MTYQEAVALADAARTNEVPQALKLRWLSLLDGELIEDLLACREEPERLLSGDGAAPVRDWRGWTPTDGSGAQDGARELLALPPHDGLYPSWLRLQIDLAQGELELYAADAALYEAARRSLACAVNRRARQTGPARLRF